jgi:hypothetical protein
MHGQGLDKYGRFLLCDEKLSESSLPLPTRSLSYLETMHTAYSII